MPKESLAGDTADLLTSLFGPRNGPVNALEEFLLMDLDQLQEHIRVISFVIYRYRLGLTDANRNIRDLERNIKEVTVASLQHWREQKQPGKDANYAFAEAEKLAITDPTVRANSQLLSQWYSRRDELTAYLKALEVKVTLTPGQQGQFNKFFDVE